MNIFVIEHTPQASARSMCNKHVPKMIVESAQLLCTALLLRGSSSVPYKPTHSKHPCTVWSAESQHNLQWLMQHALALCSEYTVRYGRIHKTQSIIESLIDRVTGDHTLHTPFAQAMPDEWKHADAVTAYRCYYIASKCTFAKWAPRAVPPSWWPFAE